MPGSVWNFRVKTGKRKHWPPVYHIDAAIPELGLAVEADGVSHLWETTKVKDRRKARFLKAKGWTVIRFWNRDILDKTEWVKSEINKVIARLQRA